MVESNLDTTLQFFKTLANESRLKILGLLAGRERSVGEIAALLELTEPTISHHLQRLRRINLVSMRSEGTTHSYTLNGKALTDMNRTILGLEPATLVQGVDERSWEHKVLTSFLDGERLKTIPASRKKRLIILQWLVEHFKPDARYPEKEVNAIIERHHPDFATLRRELISSGLMERKARIYRRIT